MKKYLIVVEKTRTGYSAYSPDIPGCIATGKTREQVNANIRDAILFHSEGMKMEGFKLPQPRSYSRYVNIPGVSVATRSRSTHTRKFSI